MKVYYYLDELNEPDSIPDDSSVIKFLRYACSFKMVKSDSMLSNTIREGGMYRFFISNFLTLEGNLPR